MAKLRTSADVLQALIDAGKIANPNRSWVAKSPESDILTAVTSEFAHQYAILDYIKYLTRLSGYEDLQNDTALRDALKLIWEVTDDELNEIFKMDLDNYSDIWGLVRHLATKAKGAIQLIFSNNDPVNIAQGTKFISTARRKEYITLEPIENKTPTSETGLYIIRIMIESANEGADGNIAAGSYMQPEVAIDGLTQTTVPVTIENGIDEETNEEYVTRIRLARRSRGVGSRAFLTNLLLADSRVYDIWLNAKGDTDFERPLGIDVWVYVQETPTSTSDTIKSSYGYVLETQPLIIEAVLINGGGLVHRRDTGYYANSVEAVDAVDGGSVGETVSYYYDKTIRDLQLQVEDLDNWLLGGRRIVLIKKAMPVKFDFSIKVYYEFGAVEATVRQNISNNLLYYLIGGTSSYGEKFNRMGLGTTLDKTDIIYIIRSTSGVDRIDIDGFTITPDSTIQRSSDPYVLYKYQYATLGTITWTE